MKDYLCPECREYIFIQERVMQSTFYSSGEREEFANVDITTPVPLVCSNCGTPVPADIALKHFGIVVPKDDE